MEVLGIYMVYGYVILGGVSEDHNAYIGYRIHENIYVYTYIHTYIHIYIYVSYVAGLHGRSEGLYGWLSK